MRLISLFVLIFLATFGTQSWAQKIDPYEVPEIYAVENKKYVPEHNVTLVANLLPLDAFYKALSASLSYTTMFSNSWAWEIINGNIAFTQNTSLKEDLLNNFAVRPQGILDYPKYYLTTNLLYTPIYSKNLVYNSSLMYSDISFLMGGGMVSFSSNDSAPMFGGGLLVRFYTGETFSWKFDSRVYYHTAKGKSSNFILSVGFGFAIELGSGAKKDEI